MVAPDTLAEVAEPARLTVMRIHDVGHARRADLQHVRGPRKQQIYRLLLLVDIDEARR